MTYQLHFSGHACSEVVEQIRAKDFTDRFPQITRQYCGTHEYVDLYFNGYRVHRYQLLIFADAAPI